MATDKEGTTSDSNDPFGEFFCGKNEEELSEAVNNVAHMLWLYYHSLREQGFDKAAAMMLVLEVQNTVWPKPTT